MWNRDIRDEISLEIAIAYAEAEKAFSAYPEKIQKKVLTHFESLGIRCVGAEEFQAALASVKKF